VVDILDREIRTLDDGQNEVRHRRSLDALPAASTMVGPALYMLSPARDGRRDGNSLLGVGGDVYEYVAWQVFRPDPSLWADRLGNVIESGRRLGFFDQSDVALRAEA
jgi:hypothetical protein